MHEKYFGQYLVQGRYIFTETATVKRSGESMIKAVVLPSHRNLSTMHPFPVNELLKTSTTYRCIFFFSLFLNKLNRAGQSLIPQNSSMPSLMPPIPLLKASPSRIKGAKQTICKGLESKYSWFYRLMWSYIFFSFWKFITIFKKYETHFFFNWRG